jgi:large subunit ribosomal protein L4
MTSLQLVDIKGKSAGDISLNEKVFGIEPNEAVMHSAVVRQDANARSGSANTKTRSEVSGGGRKPWRQKGTGRARAGSIRSPLWAGGGVTFGPKPRSYDKAMPKKVRELAVKSALSARASDLVVFKDLSGIKEGKTKEIASAFNALELTGKKVLVVLDYACDTCTMVERAARNIEGVKVICATNLNVKDLLIADKIVTTARTLEAITKRFSHESEKSA